MKTTAIKSMKLYSRVERIYDELRNIGIGEDDPLTVADLLPFDQYHYFGALAVDEAIAALAIEDIAIMTAVQHGFESKVADDGGVLSPVYETCIASFYKQLVTALSDDPSDAA